MALFVRYRKNEYALLPGDAAFKRIPYYPKEKLTALVASHHGSRGSIMGMPLANKSGMLAYSFGVGNTHNHAHKEAVIAYSNRGWTNTLETQNGNIAFSLGQIIRQVPCGGHKCTLNIIQNFGLV